LVNTAPTKLANAPDTINPVFTSPVMAMAFPNVDQIFKF
jgi:hypothetical protein